MIDSFKVDQPSKFQSLVTRQTVVVILASLKVCPSRQRLHTHHRAVWPPPQRRLSWLANMQVFILRRWLHLHRKGVCLWPP